MSIDGALLQEMAKTAEKAPEARHSYFQLQHFVIGKEPTTQAQMWQCLRELRTRVDSIESLEITLQDLTDTLDLLALKLARLEGKRAEDMLDEKEIVIKKRQIGRKMAATERTLEARRRDREYAWQEARFFFRMFQTLEKQVPLKDYDDLGAQQEYWNERLSQQISLKMLLRQPLDIETVRCALALHEDAPIRQQTLKVLESIQGQMRSLTKESNETEANKS